MSISYHGTVFKPNIAMLLLDGDATDSTQFGARLANVAEVVAVFTHPDGRAQVFIAGPTLKDGK